MAENLISLLDFYDMCYGNNSNARVYSRRGNPFEELDEKKFRERYRLSKNVVVRLLQEVQHSLHGVSYYAAIIVYYNPQIHSLLSFN